MEPRYEIGGARHEVSGCSSVDGRLCGDTIHAQPIHNHGVGAGVCVGVWVGLWWGGVGEFQWGEQRLMV